LIRLWTLWKSKGLGTEGVREGNPKPEKSKPAPSKTVMDAARDPCQAVKGLAAV
jgi:hypothetical protein